MTTIEHMERVARDRMCDREEALECSDSECSCRIEGTLLTEIARLRNIEEPAFDSRWKIARDPDDGLIYITHPHCSLLGQGENLVIAARDLLSDMRVVFAAYAGRDDLSEHAEEMVEWLKAVGGFASPEHAEADDE